MAIVTRGEGTGVGRAANVTNGGGTGFGTEDRLLTGGGTGVGRELTANCGGGTGTGGEAKEGSVNFEIDLEADVSLGKASLDADGGWLEVNTKSFSFMALSTGALLCSEMRFWLLDFIS